MHEICFAYLSSVDLQFCEIKQVDFLMLCEVAVYVSDLSFILNES